MPVICFLPIFTRHPCRTDKTDVVEVQTGEAGDEPTSDFVAVTEEPETGRIPASGAKNLDLV